MMVTQLAMGQLERAGTEVALALDCPGADDADTGGDDGDTVFDMGQPEGTECGAGSGLPADVTSRAISHTAFDMGRLRGSLPRWRWPDCPGR
jgi:hypothetical protein